jgi:hypothetical protein
MDQVENFLWTREQFEGVELPDLRLIKRLEKIACKMMAKPNSSIPQQNEKWKDIKATYRFYDSKEVEFLKLIQPHIKQTKKKSAKMQQILAIQDTCFISYGHHASVEGLSNIGGEKASGRGIILHSSLAVDPSKKQPEVIGLLDQYIHHRTKKVDEDKINLEKKRKWKESKIWEETSQRSTIKGYNTQIIEVMDREGDMFDIMKNCLSLGHDFLIRAKNNRVLEGLSKNKLLDFVETLKSSGTIKLDIRKRPKQMPRKALLNVSFSRVKILGPKSRKNEDIECNVVYVIEKYPPENQEPLKWILLTSIEVNSFEDACQIIEWYKCRWIIEEYHKGIKSGCKVEEKQLKTVERLENFLGVANIIALRLLKLRDFARNMPHISAKKVIEPLKVDILMKYNGIQKDDITIKEYYREVAKIGGFIGRKSDGEPGWQTLWKGEVQLTFMLMGAKITLVGKTYG